jgi:hypothetical protein
MFNMAGGGQGQNGGGGIGTVGQYMSQGQQPSGFGGGVSLGTGGVPSNAGQPGTFGVTPGNGLGPWMGNLQQFGFMLNNPTLIGAIQALLGGGAGGGVATHGPLHRR